MAAVSRENWVERIRDPKIECMEQGRDGRFFRADGLSR